MLIKNRVKQVKWNQLLKKSKKKSSLVKDFLFHSTCLVRNGNLLKSRVSEILVKQIYVNQRVGVIFALTVKSTSFVYNNSPSSVTSFLMITIRT